MNSFHPRIKFTSEVQDIVFPAPDAQFQFLDIKIVMDSEGRNQTKVYRKPTQTNLYSHWNSFCDKKTKIGVVKTLVRRAVSLFY